MRVRLSPLLPHNKLIFLIMNKFITKADLGEFFSKMYEANKGKNMDVTLKLNGEEPEVEIYNKAEVSFEHINILDAVPTVDDVVESIAKASL